MYRPLQVVIGKSLKRCTNGLGLGPYVIKPMDRPIKTRQPVKQSPRKPDNKLLLGTAGWNVPSTLRARIGGEGSHLQRYARVMDAVEINSSFYRPHRRSTYERWADATPHGFRFSLKVPKQITHAADVDPAIVDRFVAEAAGLGPKLSVLLIQLPPGRAFDLTWAGRLYDALRHRTSVSLACEPRHASWFHEGPDRWLAARRIARVAADPPRTKGADRPGGWQGLCYFRLHGAPRIYYSSYDQQALSKLSEQLYSALEAAEVWCIFDNTALGSAMENAISLKGR